MQTDTILLGIMVLIINIAIIYFVIESATGTKKKLEYLQMQVKLLSKIAQRNGVSDLEIKNITEMYVEPLPKESDSIQTDFKHTSVNDPEVLKSIINKTSK